LKRLSNGLCGVIFDFDGVIVDSEKHWIDIETPYLQQHIPSWQRHNYSELVGRSLSEVHELLKAKYGFRLSLERYFHDYENMALKLYSQKAQSLKGLERLSPSRYNQHTA
jgi:beta-phosphoglucomutase-like phosphatase (HAD superfamily)